MLAALECGFPPLLTSPLPFLTGMLTSLSLGPVRQVTETVTKLQFYLQLCSFGLNRKYLEYLRHLSEIHKELSK